MADEETPAEDADTPVEETPAEEADPEGDPGDTDGEGAAPADDTPGGDIDETTSGSQPPRRTGRAAAVVAGAVVAGAVAVVGAVWAIAAIVDDDGDYYGVVDYATSFEGDGEWGAEWGSGPRAYRDDRHERFEHGRRDWSDRRERAERRQERRDRRERGERDENKGRGDRDGETGHEPGESSDSGLELDAGKCETVLSFGKGDDAVTILVCNAPGAEWPGFEPGGDDDYFDFRMRPRGFWFSPLSPFYGPYGERPFKDGRPFGDGAPFGDGTPFGDGWSFRDGTPFGDGAPFRDGVPFGDGRPFEDGVPFRNGMPFDLEELFELYEQFLQDGLPFESEGFEGFEGLEGLEGFEDLFRGGERGFRFRGDGGDGSQDSFCFRDGDEEQCFGDLGQLSDEEREQLERMMEMLEGFGLEGFLGGLLDSLDGLESEFPESQTDPAGVTGA